MRERGDGEQKGEAESTEPRGRGKQRSKNKRVESLEFCLKLGLKRCVSHLFFIINLNFGLNRLYRCRYRLNQPISAVLADTTRFGANRPELVVIWRVSGNGKKKATWHQRAGSGVTHRTLRQATLDSGAAAL